MATNRTRAGLITESSTLFPDNNTQEISPQDLRDWIADGTTSFVTQKDKSTLENAIYENDSTPLAAGATVDLSTATGNFVHITGAATITSFGTLTAGARFVLVFDGICLLTYNATSLIIPGSANKTTAAGDACMIISEGSGNWRIVGYFAISGSGGGGGTPGGLDTEIQYNNGGAFGGVSDLVWDDGTNTLTIKNPRIGQSTGNGHFHMHTINTNAPSGVTDYITIYADKSPKQIGARFETDAYTSAIQFGATADRTYSLPDASGNVVIDTATQTLTNKTLTSPSITTPAITTPAVTGIATIGNGTSAGEIRLLEPSGSGSEYVAIKSQAMGGSYTLTLPADDGISGQVLLTDGSGILSWANAGPIGSKYISTTSVNTLAAGTAFTVFVSLQIPANTFGSGSIFRILQRTLRPTSATAATIRMGFNTVISTSGANMVWLSSTASTINAGAFTGTIQRHISIEGTTTSYYLAGWGSASNDDVIFAYNPSQTTAIDWSVTQYLIIGASTGASDSMQNIFTSITPLS